MGHLVSGYIDDSYLQGGTFEECDKNIKATATLITNLGFMLHPDKSFLRPTQKLIFLGFILNSIDMTVALTQEKVNKTIKHCTDLLKSSQPTIFQVSQVLGHLISNLPGVEYGKLHYRFLEIDKIQALQKNQGYYNARMKLSAEANVELKWWIDNMPLARKNISRENPLYIIHSDASKLGWGAAMLELKIGGRWTTTESLWHINYLELLAAYFAIKAFCIKFSSCHVQLQLDNSTAVAYINNMGGTRSIELNKLTKEIWEWCIQHSIWLSAVHIPGISNIDADHQSHHFHDKHEYMLNTSVFLTILNQYPDLNIDLFASRLNHQLPHYASWKPDPGCSVVDAFSINWNTKKFYAFPPFSLIARCLQKIREDQATGVLVAPLWTTQS
jgi:hypothetical protein